MGACVGVQTSESPCCRAGKRVVGRSCWSVPGYTNDLALSVPGSPFFVAVRSFRRDMHPPSAPHEVYAVVCTSQAICPWFVSFVCHCSIRELSACEKAFLTSNAAVLPSPHLAPLPTPPSIDRAEQAGRGGLSKAEPTILHGQRDRGTSGRWGR